MKLLILYALISHVLVDFYLQSDALVQRKRSEISAHVFHALTHLMVLTSLLFISVKINIILSILIITVIHFILDVVKSKIKSTTQSSIVYFVLDQIIHVVVIIFTLELMVNKFPPIQIEYLKWSKIILIALLMFRPVDLFIELVFAAIPPRDENSPDDHISNHSSSRLIGYIERFLYLTLILLHMESFVAIFIGVKTAGRWHEVQNNKLFGLQFYIGTFISVLASVAAGTFMLTL